RLGRRAAEHDFARDRGELAGEGQQGRRLPRAVGSDQRDDLTGLDPEVDVADHRDGAIARGEATALEQRAFGPAHDDDSSVANSTSCGTVSLVRTPSPR